MISILKNFNYKFSNGPLLLSRLKKEDFTEGNCRLAVQYYFYKIHNYYFKPSLILNPKAYLDVGKFIIKEGGFDKDSIGRLKEGDIVYADRIRVNKLNNLSKKDWIIQLHSAVYIGNNKLWHATVIDKKSSYWSLNKFIKYYKPVAVKRLIQD